MLTAGANFTHLVADEKSDRHQLVTDGIYRYVYPHALPLSWHHYIDFVAFVCLQLVSTPVLWRMVPVDDRHTGSVDEPSVCRRLRYLRVAILPRSHRVS